MCGLSGKVNCCTERKKLRQDKSFNQEKWPASTRSLSANTARMKLCYLEEQSTMCQTFLQIDMSMHKGLLLQTVSGLKNLCLWQYLICIQVFTLEAILDEGST